MRLLGQISWLRGTVEVSGLNGLVRGGQTPVVSPYALAALVRVAGVSQACAGVVCRAVGLGVSLCWGRRSKSIYASC